MFELTLVNFLEFNYMVFNGVNNWSVTVIIIIIIDDLVINLFTNFESILNYY